MVKVFSPIVFTYQASEKASPPKEENETAADDFDLFGSDDEEDAEKAKVVEERLKAYAEKKAKKVRTFQSIP